MENVLNLIRAERERQNKKWGEQNHDDYRWLAILTEEVGELAQAILHDEFGGSHAGTAKTALINVAAVAVQWLECMERRQLTPRALDLPNESLCICGKPMSKHQGVVCLPESASQ